MTILRFPANSKLAKALVKSKRRNKFNATRTELDGHVFDSRAEAHYWAELSILERAGCIEKLERQPPKFYLMVNDVLITTYRADFRYVENGQVKVVDVKSPATAQQRDFKIKMKLMEAVHGIRVNVVIR